MNLVNCVIAKQAFNMYRKTHKSVDIETGSARERVLRMLDAESEARRTCLVDPYLTRWVKIRLCNKSVDQTFSVW